MTKDLDDFLSFVENELGENIWVPLYKNLDRDNEEEDGALYSGLVDHSDVEKAMLQFGWDLMQGSGGPSIVLSASKVWYESHTSNYRPLVIYREFHGVRKSYREIYQELILFLNLFHDSENCNYVVDDDNGVEIEVIRYSHDEITIRRSFLEAFMAAKQMDLLLYFELTRHKIGLVRYEDERITGENVSYTRYWGDSYVKKFDTFTRVLGKKLFHCKELTEENASPFQLQKEFQNFIIKGDSHDYTSHTCDPSMLADYFGKNKGAPHYLTPVYFRKEVLQKYYGASSEYEVQDSLIYKHGFWRLRLDNNSTDHVCVFLGDLGQDIPHSEQIYWRSFNISPEDRKLSKTYFERSILGQFSDAESPDLVFKSTFEKFQKGWLEKFGWNLFLPLSESDAHCFNTLHSLTKEEQSEFDAQVLSLVKITIDSINVKGLKQIVPSDEIGSIKLLSSYLGSSGVNFDMTGFLGGLQGIPYTGVAHRRGSKYQKTISRLNIDDENLTIAFDRMLLEMTALLNEIYEKLIEIGSEYT